MSEHRPFVTLQADVFPEDSFLLDRSDTCEHDDCWCDRSYGPEDVAREAWSNIRDWVDNGYMPIVTVTMPDGSEHTVDLEAEEKSRLRGEMA